MLQFVQKWARHAARDEKGATAIEYGLIAGIIAIGIIISLTLVGSELNVVFAGIGNAFTTILAG